MGQQVIGPVPPLPSDFQKNIPFYVKIAGMAVIALGGWIQNDLAPNADFQAVFPNAHNAIGLVVMVLGGIGALCSKFPENWNNQKFQDAIAHKDAVIDNKEKLITVTTAVVDEAKAVAVEAAKAPALVPEGENPVEFRLQLAQIESVKAHDFDTATKILEWLKSRGVKAGAA